MQGFSARFIVRPYAIHDTMAQSAPLEDPPYWLWQTKRLFPHPIFAGCVSFACLLVAILFAGLAISMHIWLIGIVSFVFLCATYATAVAAISHAKDSRSTPKQQPHHSRQAKSTFAIMVLLIGVYSWLLTIAMHVFDAFFKNGPGSLKYYITLGIAFASTLFMQIYGKRVVRHHFGTIGGRNFVLSTKQAFYVVIFVLGFSVYFVWFVS